MTAIAAFESLGYPVILGDILVSSDEPGTLLTSVPSCSDVVELQLHSERYKLVGYSQKVVLISDGVAIACAGNSEAARIAAQALRHIVISPRFSLDEIPQALEPVDERINAMGLQLVGLVQSTGRSGTFGYNCPSDRHPLLGNVYAGGSGTNTIIKYATQFNGGFIDPPDATDLERAVVHGLGLSGTFLAEDFVTQDSLRSGFGGAYEICTFIGNKFQKIDDILYVWWTVQHHNSSLDFSLPLRLIKLKYEGEWLFIRSVDLVQGANGHSYTNNVDLVPPLINSTSEPRKPDRIDLNSKLICNVFSYYDRGANLRSRCKVTMVGNEAPPIRFSEEANGRIVIHVRREFLLDLARSISDPL